MRRKPTGPQPLAITARPLQQGDKQQVLFIAPALALSNVGHAFLVPYTQPDQRSRSWQDFTDDPAVTPFDHPALLIGSDPRHSQRFISGTGDAVFVGQPVNPVEIGPGHTQLLGQPLRQPALAGTGITDDQGAGEVHERLRSIVGSLAAFGGHHPRLRRAIGVVLKNVLRLTFFIKEHLADPRRVP
ncbi:hypothetical protein D9M69_539140 [compost metagenome]